MDEMDLTEDGTDNNQNIQNADEVLLTLPSDFNIQNQDSETVKNSETVETDNEFNNEQMCVINDSEKSTLNTSQKSSSADCSTQNVDSGISLEKSDTISSDENKSSTFSVTEECSKLNSNSNTELSPTKSKTDSNVNSSSVDNPVPGVSGLSQVESPVNGESSASNSNTRVGFSKPKMNLKNRHFRRKNTRRDDNEGGSSSDEEQPAADEPSANAEETRDDDDNSVDLRLSTSHTDFSSDSTTTESEDSHHGPSLQINFEKICNPQLKHTWFVLPELLRRQVGFSAKFNSHAQFQQRYYGSLHAVQRLELMSKLKFHDGCVNSLGFNSTGSLIASGSDDLRVVIWDWPSGRRKTSFVTRHKSNVFQSKFLSLSCSSELHIVTSARDGQVWLWQLSSEGLRGSRQLGAHKGASHKLSLLREQPHVVLSCGEDAWVLSHDVRDIRANKLVSVKDAEDEKVALYSIHSNPLNSYEFCVCGHDYAVSVYDQRKLPNDGVPLKRYFAQNSMRNRYITAAVYNYTGTEILASYNEDNIYLFDTAVEGCNYVQSYMGHSNNATIKGVNFFGPQSEFIISGSDCGHIYFWDKKSQGIVQWLRADRVAVNCLEPHPQMPVLASSGLDSDVKVWVPSSEEPNKMAKLKKTVKTNLGNGNRDEYNNSRTMWMLWRVLNGQIRSYVPSSSSEDDDHEVGGSATPPSFFTSPSSDSDADDHDADVTCLPS